VLGTISGGTFSVTTNGSYLGVIENRQLLNSAALLSIELYFDAIERKNRGPNFFILSRGNVEYSGFSIS